MGRTPLIGEEHDRALGRPANWMRWPVLAIAILLSLWIGIRAASPPPVASASAPATLFSADRAIADVRVIAMRPHPTASVDLLRVRGYLTERLRALGIEPEERRYLIDPKGFETLHGWNPKATQSSELVDLIGVLPGRDRLKPAVAMMAHMDTVWGSPGGGDDSIGVATILETLRAIRARGTPERDVVVLFTDGEEIGLSGARAFWPHDGLADHVGVVVNLEARGSGGRATMFETGDMNGAMIGLLGQSVTHPVANSMAVLAYRLMPNNTDFTPVREMGLPGFNFAIMGRPQYYHSPRATADRLDPRSLQDMGDQTLGLVSALAMTSKLPEPAPDAVFFDIVGHGLITYPPATGWLVLLVAGVTLGGVVFGLFRTRAMTARDAIDGAVAFAWLIAHAALLLMVLNLVSRGAGHPNYYDRLAALPRLETQAALASLSALLGWLMLRRFDRRAIGLIPAAVLSLLGLILGGPVIGLFGAALLGMLAGWFARSAGATRWGGWIGALAWILLVGVVTQAEAPAAAWIFAWPALLIALAALLIAWIDPRFARWWSWAISGVALVIVIAPLTPLAHLAFLGIGAPLPIAMLPAVMIVATAIWPMARIGRVGQTGLVLAGIPLVVALAIAVHVRTDPIAPTVPAYSLAR